MIYEFYIEGIELCCGFEGHLTISSENFKSLKVYYQAEDWFIESNIIKSNYIPNKHKTQFVWNNENENKPVPLDIWWNCAKAKQLNVAEKQFPNSEQNRDESIKGTIISILSPCHLVIDCGVLIDIELDQALENNLQEGNFVEISGCYQVFFPGTERSKSEIS